MQRITVRSSFQNHLFIVLFIHFFLPDFCWPFTPVSFGGKEGLIFCMSQCLLLHPCILFSSLIPLFSFKSFSFPSVHSHLLFRISSPLATSQGKRHCDTAGEQALGFHIQHKTLNNIASFIPKFQLTVTVNSCDTCHVLCTSYTVSHLIFTDCSIIPIFLMRKQRLRKFKTLA